MLVDVNKLNEFVSQNPDWSVLDNSLSSEFTFKDFSEALAFVVRVGIESEKLDHHPDIRLHSWNKVKLNLSTHSEGGITEKDFRLSAAISKLK